MQLKTIQKAVHLLNMPPIMNAEEPMVNIYHRDPEIAEALTHKFVFTDVSMGVKDRVSKMLSMFLSFKWTQTLRNSHS